MPSGGAQGMEKMTRSVRAMCAVLGLASFLAVACTGQTMAATSPAEAAAKVDKLLADDLNAGAAAPGKTGGKNDAKQSGSEQKGAYPATADEHKAAPTAPAQVTDDATFLRRVSLDLIGRPPSPQEIKDFAADSGTGKRARLVDRLLADPQFGQNWAHYWRDVILFRRADERAQLVGPTLTTYLTEQFNKDVPWDQIARAFITATGDIRENGATGIIMAQAGNSADVTSEVSRIFMGIQIQCAQCHDHKTDRWKRTQFHELAAFFPRIALLPTKAKPPMRSFEVSGVDRDRARLVDRLKKNNLPYPELGTSYARPQQPGCPGDANATDLLRHRAEASVGD